VVRNSAGNAGKDTKRCPACGHENLLPRVPRHEVLILTDCHQCGFPIRVRPDRVAAWEREWRAAHGTD